MHVKQQNHEAVERERERELLFIQHGIYIFKEETPQKNVHKKI